jgi:hypothetical protein
VSAPSAPQRSLARKLAPPALVSALAIGLTMAPLLPSTEAATSAEVAAITPGLVEELSTEFSSTVREADGSYTMQASTVPINYLDESGRWKPIDNTLVDAPGTTYDVQNAGNSFTARLPEDPQTTPVKFVEGAAWVTMRMHGAQDVAAVVTGAEATYVDVLNTDGVTYEVVNTGLKETITLDAPPTSPVTYTYTLDASAGLTPSLRSDGGIAFSNGQGEPVFAMPAGVMIDAAAAPAQSSHVTYSLAPSGSAWTLAVTPDYSWLSAPERVYPVGIDPTLTNQPVSRDCWMNQSSPTTYYCGNPSSFIRVGRADTSTSSRKRGLLDFDVSTIPSSALVRDATISLYLDPSQTATTATADYAFYTAGKAFDSANWNTAGAAGNWAGGDPGSTAYGTKSLSGTGASAYKTFTDLGPLIQGWVDESITHSGLVLKQVGESTANTLYFYSSSNATSNNNKRPYLNVTYTNPPSAPSLEISSCRGRCDPAFRVTGTLTPILTATSTDLDSSTLTYTWEIRTDNTTSALVATHSQTAVPDVAAPWSLPSGVLVDESAYQATVVASDGQTSSSATFVIATDVDNAPSAATDLTMQPCSPCLGTLATSTMTPSVLAQFSDPDSTTLRARLEVRNAAGAVSQSPIILVPGQSMDLLSVPAGVIPSNGNYEFRVGSADDSSAWVWSVWSNFTVAVPTQVRDPILAGIIPCSPAPCAAGALDATTPSLTPTFQVTPQGEPGVDEAISIQFAIDPDNPHQAFDIGTTGGAQQPLTWTAPADLLGPDEYVVRLGARNASSSPADTAWGGWQSLNIDSEVVTEDVPYVQRVAGRTYAQGIATSQLDPRGDTAESYVSADAALRTTDADLAWKYAPVLYLHDGVKNSSGDYTTNPETHWPYSINTFIDNSDLYWAQDGVCNDDRLDDNPTNSDLGTNDRYTHKTANAVCADTGPQWDNVSSVAPFRGAVSQDDNGEGMYLDLPDSSRDGGGLQSDEPIYYLFGFNDDGERYVRYWFGYADSATRRASTTRNHHEGDWESMAIRLAFEGPPSSGSYVPKQAQYFFHHDSCVESWGSSLKNNAGRLELGVARDSHGVYPPGGDPASASGFDDLVEWEGSTAKIWDARTSLSNATTRAWWGFGGGFGQVGLRRDTTGPWGPNAYRGEPSFNKHDCSQND